MAPDGEDNSRVRSGRLFTHSPVKFGRPMRPIHCGEVSAWKGNSANFAITEFSEVRQRFIANSPPLVCMLEQRGYGSASTSSTQRSTTYTQRPYFRPASRLPFGPAQRSVCHHPAPSRRDARSPLHPLHRSKGDKAGRPRRPRKSGERTGRLKDRFLVALFYGLLTRSQERRRDGCIQLPPVQISLRATRGVRGAAK